MLKQKLEEQLSTLSGQVSLLVKYLKTGEEFAFSESEPFWAASVIKVPISATLFKQAEENKLNLDHRLTISNQNLVQGSGITKLISRETLFTIADLNTLMLTLSDNSATNELVDLVGAENIEEYMNQLGLSSTTFRHKMMIPAGKGPNLTTARDMATLLELLYSNKIAGSQKIIQTMCEQIDRTKIPLFLPNDVKVAHKYGALPQAVHEIGLIFGNNPFIFCFLSDDQEDKQATTNVLATCAKLCYDFGLKNGTTVD